MPPRFYPPKGGMSAIIVLFALVTFGAGAGKPELSSFVIVTQRAGSIVVSTSSITTGVQPASKPPSIAPPLLDDDDESTTAPSGEMPPAEEEEELEAVPFCSAEPPVLVTARPHADAQIAAVPRMKTLLLTT